MELGKPIVPLAMTTSGQSRLIMRLSGWIS